ncbi:CLUMA_CG002600, isoform A [Clunio marinus]|uniref:CLUMA_CG002600, isoform A n=1 Tax=Clunio marinus TaxID=568069 RepID=A0A1J1HLL0_9DIPT|nr:CLUMA_CG002600, isoform A [Clunio marinus]
MEDKLEEYRLRKRRQKVVEGFKERIFKMIAFSTSQNNESSKDTNVEIEETAKQDEIDIQSLSTDTEITESTEPAPRSWLTYCTWLIYFLIWATLFAIAVELKFGSVFFIISLLIGICINTRVKPKGVREVSAYSVFNENCEAIDGTFKAEMFEKQLGLRRL